jgi:hypothetical protein
MSNAGDRFAWRPVKLLKPDKGLGTVWVPDRLPEGRHGGEALGRPAQSSSKSPRSRRTSRSRQWVMLDAVSRWSSS